jgi:hypothetical protein
MTSMAILLALSVGTGLGGAIRSGHANFTARLADGSFSFIYAHVTTLPTLIVLMTAWTGIWVMLCSEEPAKFPTSTSPVAPVRNLRERYEVWVPPADPRIVAPRWWLALTFGDDRDAATPRHTQDDPGAAP